MAAQTSAGGGGSSISAYSAAQGNKSEVKDEHSNLPPVPRSIVHFMQNQPQREEGVHVSHIAKAVGADAEAIE